MATKRIDVEKLDDNNVIIRNCNDIPVVIDRVKGFYVIDDKMWNLKFRFGEILITSKSKAIKKKTNQFNIRLKEGSYFFYNSATNWYWYHRDSKIQTTLDKYYIDKIISVDNNKLFDTAKAIFYAIQDEKTNLLSPTNLELLPTIKYYGDDNEKINTTLNGAAIISNYKQTNPYDISTTELTGINLFVAEINFKFNNWLIVENRSYHRELYIRKDMNISDINFDDYNIKLRYPSICI